MHGEYPCTIALIGLMTIAVLFLLFKHMRSTTPTT